jgi:hypothetical protein
MTSYYLLDNNQHFSVHRNGMRSSATANLSSGNLVKLVQNVDEKRAVCATEELLTTASRDDASVVVIKCDGRYFTRRPSLQQV